MKKLTKPLHKVTRIVRRLREDLKAFPSIKIQTGEEYNQDKDNIPENRLDKEHIYTCAVVYSTDEDFGGSYIIEFRGVMPIAIWVPYPEPPVCGYLNILETIKANLT